MKFIIGSRGSKLALAQSEEVRTALLDRFPDLEIEIKVIHTKGDKILNKPLNQIGDKGLFTEEIEKELLAGTIDLAVHSMKDMPSSIAEGLCFTGTIQAASSNDCLVFNKEGMTFKDLPYGAIVATGSLRRKLQLLALRSDLQVVGIRGNVLTRLEKMETQGYDALVLAAAGLERLHLEHRIGDYLSYQEMVPACAQGILAIEVKENAKVLPYLNEIIDENTTKRMKLERIYLETINGNCHLPIGCHVELKDNVMIFDAILGKENSDQYVTKHITVKDHYEDNIKKIALEMKDELYA